jgi:hypothetical protein
MTQNLLRHRNSMTLVPVSPNSVALLTYRRDVTWSRPNKDLLNKDLVSTVFRRIATFFCGRSCGQEDESWIFIVMFQSLPVANGSLTFSCLVDKSSGLPTFDQHQTSQAILDAGPRFPDHLSDRRIAEYVIQKLEQGDPRFVCGFIHDVISSIATIERDSPAQLASWVHFSPSFDTHFRY